MESNQTDRLSLQHRNSHGVVGIFTQEAKLHDKAIHNIAKAALDELQKRHPKLKFQHRESVSKTEINQALHSLDKELGQGQFVDKASIKPDGGLIEVMDDNQNWRVVLVSEAKRQGKDIENIKAGKKVGKNDDQDLMVGGNAIERAYKNIAEIGNLMLGESYFPYVIFLEGSNFLMENVEVTTPTGETVTLEYKSGTLNRLDRLTAANYGMPFNKNLCKNKFIPHKDKMIMLQAPSIYNLGNGEEWSANLILEIMLEIADTSIQMLYSECYHQLNEKGDGSEC